MSEILKNSVIFPIGNPVGEENFAGTAYLQMLTGGANPIGNVTFEPGARNKWHSHEGGQILLVTGGEGFYQEEGKPAQRLKTGDVVEIPADVKHWHGATKDSWFVHLAIKGDPSKPGNTWMEPVSDEYYAQVNK